MNGVLGAAEICCMTGVAGSGNPCVFSAGVARLAVRRCVRSGQRKFGRSAVIEICARPASGRVTGSAASGKPCSRVVRIVGRRVITGMTADAVG